MREESTILTVNVGSSSLKISLRATERQAAWPGSFQRLGTEGCNWTLSEEDGTQTKDARPLSSAIDALPILRDWIERSGTRVVAVAHRIVHGGRKSTTHGLATEEMLASLEEAKVLAPEHVPAELRLLRALRDQIPGVPHVLCFDTVFHATLPEEAFAYALPRRAADAGVRRYGFHGLSYEHLVTWLEERGKSGGRSILAHLGNGCSMAAVVDGRSIDTTMGFTPAGGLVMGTRCGDLDPGLFRFFAEELHLRPDAIDRMVNHESGLLGLSGVSADVRELIARQDDCARSALALRVFARTAKKHLCALAGVMGGVDRIVFAGGIGENSPFLRGAILSDLEFLGIHLDETANREGRTVLSRDGSDVRVYVTSADEEEAMARIARRFISPGPTTIPPPVP